MEMGAVTIDFLYGLPRTRDGHDGVLVIADRLTKTTRFLPIKAIYILDKLAKLYIDEIVSLYGAPLSIVQIEILALHLNFGQVCKKPWILSYIFNTTFHPRQMVNPKGLYRLSMTC